MSFYYPYRFVQNFEGNSGHLLSKRLYSFKSTKSNFTYWVWVELYDYNVYAIKFHLKNHRHSERKYNILSSTFEPRRIIHTCINIMLDIYHQDDHASFGFIGSNLDEEGIDNTKRFRFYSKIMATNFSDKYFLHTELKDKSAYLMVNKIELENNPNLINDIQDAFTEQYEYFD